MNPFRRKSRTKQAKAEPPCTCPRRPTERQRRAFGDLPVKWRDCPRHDR